MYNSRLYAFAHINDPRYPKEVMKYLAPSPDENILEIGCGRGHVIKELQETIPESYGIDISPEAIANGVAKNMSIMDAEKLEFEENTFDKICTFHTIEHLHHPERLLQGIQRILKPKGKALIVYPAEPIRGFFSVGAACALFKNPFRTREIHLQKLTPGKIKELLKETELTYVDSKFSLIISPHFSTVVQKL